MSSEEKDKDEEGDIIYRKADYDDTENEDIWDDTALIKMYDEMINKTYDSLGEQSTSAQKKKKTSGPKIQWHVGDRCMAPYYDDQLWYPAVVKKLFLEDDQCEVLYDFYDELARVDIADLTKRLHTWSAVSRIGRRNDWSNFSRCAIRPSNYRFGGDRQQQRYRKRGAKRCYPERMGIWEMGGSGGIKKRKRNRKLFAVCPDSAAADAAAFESSITFGLPRSVYMMRVLDNITQQKPTGDDEEVTSDGNTTEETFQKQEEESQASSTHDRPKKLPKKMQQKPKEQSTPIPSLMPPAPLAFSSVPPPDDEEALASMLMSWYMSGYHTGYYQAVRDQKKREEKKVPE